MLSGAIPIGAASWVPSVLLNRLVLLANPIDSIWVRPAPGTIKRASFSLGSIVR